MKNEGRKVYFNPKWFVPDEARLKTKVDNDDAVTFADKISWEEEMHLEVFRNQARGEAWRYPRRNFSFLPIVRHWFSKIRAYNGKK